MRLNFLTSIMTQIFSRPYVNFEWFFEPEEFKRFWEEIRAQKQTYRFFKLLIRFNTATAPTSNPYYNTVSIDVSVLNTPEMLRRCKRLYDHYKPLEHSGKFRIETWSM
jgi:hypothetical protein